MKARLSLLLGASMAACCAGAEDSRTFTVADPGVPIHKGSAVTIPVDAPEVAVDVSASPRGLRVRVQGKRYTWEDAAHVTIDALDPTSAVTLYVHGVAEVEATRFDVDAAGEGFHVRLSGFRETVVEAVDPVEDATARLHGDDAVQTVVTGPRYTQLAGTGYRVEVVGFPLVDVHGGTGFDTAEVFDSPADDQLEASPGSTVILFGDSEVRLTEIDRVFARAGVGEDSALVLGTPGYDYFEGKAGHCRLTAGDGRYDVELEGFDRVDAIGQAGDDAAELRDVPGDDTLVVDGQAAEFFSDGYEIAILDFALVIAHGDAGGRNAVEERSPPAFELDLRGDWEP